MAGDNLSIDYELPSSVRRVLLALADFAKAEQVMILSCTEQQGCGRVGMYDLEMWGPTGDSRRVTDLMGNPLESLEILQLIRRTKSGAVLVLPTGFERAAFVSRGRAAKWIIRAVGRWRDPLLLLSVVLSVSLTVIQIVEHMG